MTPCEIEQKLSTRVECLDAKLSSEIRIYLKKFQSDENYCWCLEQIYKVKKNYLSAYQSLKKGNFEEAWYMLERTKIELSFLCDVFDIGNEVHDSYSMVYIKNVVPRFQKLYPYKIFVSREILIQKEICSICGKEMKLRGGCPHQTGKLYMGKMCSRIVKKSKFLGAALVTDPFDKYGVLHVKGQEYDYSLIDFIASNLHSPYDLWYYEMYKTKIPEYAVLGRNDRCLCGSGKKFKHCCMDTDNIYSKHYRFHIKHLDE